MVKSLTFRGTDILADVTSKVRKVISEVEGVDVQDDDIVLFHRPKNCNSTFNELDCEMYTLNDYHVSPHDRLMYIRYHSEWATYETMKTEFTMLKARKACAT